METQTLGPEAKGFRYLLLDDLAADPKLARRLPSELAWRYHALPLAEDEGRVTVVMADPDNTEARDAVVAALGPGSCVVRGSLRIIDTQLAEIWGDEAFLGSGPKVWAFPDPATAGLRAYDQAFGALLGANVGLVNTEEEAEVLAGQDGPAGCDLLIVRQHDQPLIRHLLSRSTKIAQVSPRRSTVPFALLVAPQPRWPLERILVVICGEGEDDAAVEWSLRLARPSSATVTVLAVVPPAPIMLRGLDRMEESVASLLTSDTILGRKMHQVARHLVEWEVEGTLRLRQGAPDQQICREAVEGDYDLVIMATSPCRWWLRQLKRDPICSLLRWVDRPLLLTEPAFA